MSSHFYRADGSLVEGGMRAARKERPQPMPSVTTVLSGWQSYGLTEYLRRQMFEAAATTHRQPGWTDDQHYEACCTAADEHSKAARDKGNAFHDWVQRFNGTYFKEGPQQYLHGWEGQCEKYHKWFTNNVIDVVAIEKFVASEHGYAGRMDMALHLNRGDIVVTDVKTQALGKKRSFNHYLKWALQLAAYEKAFGGADEILMSIVVGSDATELEVYEWPRRSQYYFQLFLGALAIWKEDNNWI